MVAEASATGAARGEGKWVALPGKAEAGSVAPRKITALGLDSTGTGIPILAQTTMNYRALVAQVGHEFASVRVKWRPGSAYRRGARLGLAGALGSVRLGLPPPDTRLHSAARRWIPDPSTP